LLTFGASQLKTIEHTIMLLDIILDHDISTNIKILFFI